ncbi:MAG TPA: hypothetical protein VGR61_10720 [Candidatus Dormibacteraeota bacterium]|nr:hypothetical protein [Candidatus Dormibacteraeota bacterium]
MAQSGERRLHPHLLELFCQGVRVRGTAVTHVRVSDMMNEADTWLDMTALELWPLSAAETSEPERHDVGRLRKSSIEVAAEATDTPPLHSAEEFGFHVVKTPRRVLVLTANFAIRADLHVTNQADIQNTLDVFRGTFLPLTTASATPISAGRLVQPFARKFILVNLEMINLVCDAAEAPPVFFPE